MEHERRDADQRFDDRVAAQQVAPSPRQAAGRQAAERHPPHEKREHQRLRVRRVPEEQLQVVAPDRLVDEPGESGDGEQQKEHRATVRRRSPAGRVWRTRVWRTRLWRTRWFASLVRVGDAVARRFYGRRSGAQSRGARNPAQSPREDRAPFARRPAAPRVSLRPASLPAPRRAVLRLLRLYRRVRALLLAVSAIDRTERVPDRVAAFADAADANRCAAPLGVARRSSWLARAPAAGNACSGTGGLRGRVRDDELPGPVPGTRRVRVLLERDHAAPRCDHARGAARSRRAVRRDQALGLDRVHRRRARRGLDSRPHRDRQPAVDPGGPARGDARADPDAARHARAGRTRPRAGVAAPRPARRDRAAGGERADERRARTALCLLQHLSRGRGLRQDRDRRALVARRARRDRRVHDGAVPG